MKEHNPIVYVKLDEATARKVHEAFLKLIGSGRRAIVLVEDIDLVTALKTTGALKEAIEA